jgi:hypothetical protein
MGVDLVAEHAEHGRLLPPRVVGRGVLGPRAVEQLMGLRAGAPDHHARVRVGDTAEVVRDQVQEPVVVELRGDVGLPVDDDHIGVEPQDDVVGVKLLAQERDLAPRRGTAGRLGGRRGR